MSAIIFNEDSPIMDRVLIKQAAHGASIVPVFKRGTTDPVLDFKGKPKGFVTLRSINRVFVTRSTTTSLLTKTRQVNLFGAIEDLQHVLEAWTKLGKVPGRIVINEVHEDALPTMSEEDRERILKRVSKDGPVLKRGGKDIFSYNYFVHESSAEHATAADVFIAHDNFDEIRAWRELATVENSAKPELGA